MVTEFGEPVEIVKWNCRGLYPILAVIDDGNTDDCCFYKEDGVSMGGDHLYIVMSASENLHIASMEWLMPRLDESYKPYGEGKMMELTRFDGYAMLDAIEYGTQWQQKQIMNIILKFGEKGNKNYEDCQIDDNTEKTYWDGFKSCAECIIKAIKEDGL